MLENNNLITSQQRASRLALDYITKRANGEIKSLLTKYDNLNRVTLNGLEYNTIFSIAGLSGGGKSLFSKNIRNSLISCNPDEKIKILSFNYEMLAMKQIIRELATETKLSTRQLLSVEDKLSEEAIELIKVHLNKIKNYPISFVEVPQNYKKQSDIIRKYYDKECSNNEILVVEIDQTYLVKGIKDSEDKRIIIENTMLSLNEDKKFISANGGKIIFIVMSQLNRDLRTTERLKNPQGHYPITADIFQSSAVDYASDYLLILNIPRKSNIKEYGINSLPVCVQNDKKDILPLVYGHLLKNREGSSDNKVLPFIPQFQHFDLTQFTDFRDCYKKSFLLSNGERCINMKDSKLKEQIDFY